MQRRRLEGHRAQIGVGELPGVAELLQDGLDGLAVGDAFVDVPAQLERNLRAHRRGRGQLSKHAIDVVVCDGHDGVLSCPSSRAMASANVLHSVVSVASSTRPASVSR